MKKALLVHGALLVGAAGFAWQTYTRDRDSGPKQVGVKVWPAASSSAVASAVESVALKAPLREVTVVKKGDYYWAVVKKSTPPPPRPAVPDGGAPESMDFPEQGPTTTTEFPVGEEGEKSLAKLAALEALRDLGKTDEREDYGLGEKSEKLTLKSGGATHELVLGAKAFGGDDRYVLDPSSGHVYVVAGELMRPFDAPEFSLRERKLHGFAPADVAEVSLKNAAGKERKLVKSGPTGWADPKSADKPDQSLANFMERAEQLIPTEYAQAPDAASLTAVGTIEYRAQGGKVLGTVELSKKPAQAPGQFDYFVKSERTRGLAKVSALSAARVDTDLAEVLK